VTPTVSIVTPYLDAAAHLSEAIASVHDQSFPEWELILIDDRSTDDSRAIADTAAASDPRVRSLSLPDHVTPGAAAARNWGISQSRGEFLVFLDADDRLLPDKLRTEVDLMRQNPDIGMTCGGTIWWYPGEEKRNWSDEARLRAGVYDGSVLLSRAILLQRMHVPCLCAVMVRRSALPEGTPFEEQFALYEDQTLLAKVALNLPVYIGGHLTALYRQHGESTSARAEKSGEYQRHGPHSARTAFLRWVRGHAAQTVTGSPSVEDALSIAEAVQSGDRRQLTARQRALAFAIKAEKLLRRNGDRARRILRLIYSTQAERKSS
jgi:hypothetical protein